MKYALSFSNYTYLKFLLLIIFCPYQSICNDIDRLINLQNKVKQIFYHAYDGYLQYAFPMDELQPLTCKGRDTWGSFSLTLIDSLDTLLVLGNKTEFARVAKYISENTNFDYDKNVSVFESNIRVIGGLLSAHILAGSIVPKYLYDDNNKIVPKNWPCHGKLLDLAVNLADKLLPAFQTTTKMPFGTVNLKNGVPNNETPITCTAGVGTFLIEFGTLSKLTGNEKYIKAAEEALDSLFDKKSKIDLVGNHIDTKTGKWIATGASIGGAIDSYFEYLVKGSILFQNNKYFEQFLVFKNSINKYIKTKDNLYVTVDMNSGKVSDNSMESLSCFYPGIETLYGDNENALKTIKKISEIALAYGGFPEKWKIDIEAADSNRAGYPLRPELIESIFYLYRSTKNPILIDIAESLLFSIEKLTKTECGYATIKSVHTHELEDRMESFFLAETLKYFYLIFDPDNFLHDQDGNNFYHTGSVFNLFPDSTPDSIKNQSFNSSKNTKNSNIYQNNFIKDPSNPVTCILNSGGYIYNTEAHPIDPGALNCCQDFWNIVNKNDPFKHFDKKNIKNVVNSEFYSVSGSNQCLRNSWWNLIKGT